MPLRSKLHYWSLSLNTDVVRKDFGGYETVFRCARREREVDLDTICLVPSFSNTLYTCLIHASNWNPDLHDLWCNKNPLFETGSFIAFVADMETDIAQHKLAGVWPNISGNNRD